MRDMQSSKQENPVTQDNPVTDMCYKTVVYYMYKHRILWVVLLLKQIHFTSDDTCDSGVNRPDSHALLVKSVRCSQ